MTYYIYNCFDDIFLINGNHLFAKVFFTKILIIFACDVSETTHHSKIFIKEYILNR